MNTQESGATEMMGIDDLAVAGVILLAKKALEKVGGELGGRLVKLYDTVKARLTGAAAKETLGDFEAKPEDSDRQAALRVQLKKALEADPVFRAELAALVEEIKSKGGDRITLNADVTGDHNVNTQIVGSSNVVG